MRVRVNVGFGFTHPPVDVDINETEPIEAVKQIMAVQHKLSGEWQSWFVLPRTPIKDGVPLTEYNVQEGTNLLMLVKTPRALRVFVQPPEGRPVCLDVWDNAVVHDVKLAYEERFNLKPSKQSLWLRGIELKDPQTPLSNHGVKNEDTLELRLVSAPMEEAAEAALQLFEKSRRWLAGAIEHSRRVQAILFPSPEERRARSEREAEAQARAWAAYFESIPPPSWIVYAMEEHQKELEAKALEELAKAEADARAELACRPVRPPPRLASLGPVPEPLTPCSPCFGRLETTPPVPQVVCAELGNTAHFGDEEEEQQELPLLLTRLSSRAFPDLHRDASPKSG